MFCDINESLKLYGNNVNPRAVREAERVVCDFLRNRATVYNFSVLGYTFYLACLRIKKEFVNFQILKNNFVSKVLNYCFEKYFTSISDTISRKQIDQELDEAKWKKLQEFFTAFNSKYQMNQRKMEYIQQVFVKTYMDYNTKKYQEKARIYYNLKKTNKKELKYASMFTSKINHANQLLKQFQQMISESSGSNISSN